METEVLFKETQRFRQWWLWLILIGLNGVNVWFLIEKYIYKKAFPDTTYHSYSGAEVGCIIVLLVTALIMITKLETMIDTNRIEVRFFPFHLKVKTFLAQNIGLAYVRKYKPLSEYGGWGLRNGLAAKGKAYNISGNQGIQLVFKDGSWLLIGTQKPDEAGAALQKAGFLKTEMY